MSGTERFEADVVVVGSGPGGAGVARDLTRAGKRVHIMELGPDAPPTGKAVPGALRFLGGLSGVVGLKKGVVFTRQHLPIIRGVSLGGSSMLYLGTATDPDAERWRPFGFDLQGEAEERKREIGVELLADHCIGDGVKHIARVANDIGYDWAKLPKFIDSERCEEGCNSCIYGCPHGAKWQARDWVLGAVNRGATLHSPCACEKVIIEDGAAVGVRGKGAGGKTIEVRAERVVISAGGLGTPLVLQRSGIDEAGRSFFIDPFVMTTGVFEKPVGQGAMMATGMHLEDEGIMITDMQYPRMVLMTEALLSGKLAPPFRYRTTMPLMIKIRDDARGTISSKGKIDKPLTDDDRAKLDRGKAIATEILKAAGAKKVWHTRVGAAHPGGTCAMGRVVDNTLEAETKHLYVCDTSVIPKPFGMPPTLTCLALSKRLSKHLLEQLAN